MESINLRFIELKWFFFGYRLDNGCIRRGIPLSACAPKKNARAQKVSKVAIIIKLPKIAVKKAFIDYTQHFCSLVVRRQGRVRHTVSSCVCVPWKSLPLNAIAICVFNGKCTAATAKRSRFEFPCLDWWNRKRLNKRPAKPKKKKNRVRLEPNKREFEMEVSNQCQCFCGK